MERIWKADAEGKCSDVDLSNQSDATPANNQLLLRGQTLIGFDGKLKKAEAVSGKLGQVIFKVEVFGFKFFSPVWRTYPSLLLSLYSYSEYSVTGQVNAPRRQIFLPYSACMS